MEELGTSELAKSKRLRTVNQYSKNWTDEQFRQANEAKSRIIKKPKTTSSKSKQQYNKQYNHFSQETSFKTTQQSFLPPSVALSPLDRSQQLLLSHDQMEIKGVNGGYRMARATHGVHNGTYYWEAEILEPAEEEVSCQWRLGWSTRQGILEAPVGHDKHGYSYRGKNGSKCHEGVRDDSYRGEAYGPGDIIGCFLNLDIEENENNQMRFFKNGIDQGVAYRGAEIPKGVYFPAVSLYMHAGIRVNFGPSFILKHETFGANAVSDEQPMNPEDRKLHDIRIANIRLSNSFCRSQNNSKK